MVLPELLRDALDETDSATKQPLVRRPVGKKSLCESLAVHQIMLTRERKL